MLALLLSEISNKTWSTTHQKQHGNKPNGLSVMQQEMPSPPTANDKDQHEKHVELRFHGSSKRRSNSGCKVIGAVSDETGSIRVSEPLEADCEPRGT